MTHVKLKEAKNPIYKKWWFITLLVIFILGAIGAIKNIEKVLNDPIVTNDEFNKLKKGMSYEEVKKIVGGKAKEEHVNSYNSSIVEYIFEGDDNSKISLLFVNEKLDYKSGFANEEESIVTNSKTQEESATFQSKGELNAEQHPAKSGAILYDKTESKFKGMEYYFKGEVVGVKSLEGLFGDMEDAILIKNEQGYVLPVFPPYEIDVNIGDTVEASGPLSGDGYATSDLGVSNVVGMTGAMNATQVNVNGEIQ
ncbi:hypothetical protein ACQQ6W_16020 [Lysinibacillus fusiformis]